MRIVAFVVAVLACPVASMAQSDDAGAAYYEFLRGRQLESEGDLEGALDAFRRAAAADPEAAEIPADIANVYLRLNNPNEAIDAAERSLELDSANVTANRILGSIYASITQAPRISEAEARQTAEQAIEYLERADPANALGVKLLLGRMYVRAERWDEGIETLSALVMDEPGSRDAVSLLAEAYRGAGRGDEAIQLLERSASNSSRLSMLLGEFYQEEGRWADAAAAYERAAEGRPRDIDLKLRWATALLNVGQTPALEAGRAVLNDVLESEPSQARALYLLVQTERSLLNLDGAERAARRMVQAEPDGVWGPYALALVQGDRENHQAVIDTLAPVLETWGDRRGAGQGLNPARLHEQLGVAYLGLGEYETAAEQFERARSLSPGNLLLARQQASALLAAGQLSRGVALLEDVLEQSGRRPGAYQALGELYVEAGQVPAALALLDRVAADLPGDTSVFFGVGAALERADHVDEAESAFRRVIDTDPDHAQALNYLGYMLIDRGRRVEESLSYITRALELDPENPAIIDSLGWAYYRLDQFDMAERFLQRAAAELTTNSVIQDHLGDTLARLGRLDEAREAWERALAGDGDSIDPATIRRKIRNTTNR